MTHPSSDELRTWFERGGGDRARMIGHLAECETCRKALSALAANAEPAADAAPVISIADAVPRGYAALKSTPAARPVAWRRRMYGLAAAAVILLAVIWVSSPAKVSDDNTVRSSELVGLSPISAGDAAVFTFASPFQASRYRLTVRDASGALVLSMEGQDGSIAVDRSVRDRLTAGQSYAWVITALDRSGETIAESKPQTFRFQP